MNKPQLSKAVHEVVHTRSRCTYHRGQRFLADLGDHRSGLVLFPILRKQQQHSGQAFFTGIEELINQVCLDTDAALENKSVEKLRKTVVFVKGSYHLMFFYPQDLRVANRRSCSQAEQTARSNTLMSDKISGAQQAMVASRPPLETTENLIRPFLM